MAATTIRVVAIAIVIPLANGKARKVRFYSHYYY